MVCQLKTINNENPKIITPSDIKKNFFPLPDFAIMPAITIYLLTPLIYRKAIIPQIVSCKDKKNV